MIELVGEVKGLLSARDGAIEVPALHQRQGQPRPACDGGKDRQAAGMADQLAGEKIDASFEVRAGLGVPPRQLEREAERLPGVHDQRDVTERFAGGQRALSVGSMPPASGS